MNPPPKIFFIWAIVIIISGSLVGFLLTKIPGSKSSNTGPTPGMVKSATEVGSTDTKTFRDKAVGTLEKGGLSGEGTHHLVLDSNPKNSAYLISSVVDLDEFVGKHIEVWGETHKSSKVPWLMDVGRIKILE